MTNSRWSFGNLRNAGNKTYVVANMTRHKFKLILPYVNSLDSFFKSIEENYSVICLFYIPTFLGELSSVGLGHFVLLRSSLNRIHR